MTSSCSSAKACTNSKLAAARNAAGRPARRTASPGTRTSTAGIYRRRRSRPGCRRPLRCPPRPGRRRVAARRTRRPRPKPSAGPPTATRRSRHRPRSPSRAVMRPRAKTTKLPWCPSAPSRTAGNGRACAGPAHAVIPADEAGKPRREPPGPAPRRPVGDTTLFNNLNIHLMKVIRVCRVTLGPKPSTEPKRQPVRCFNPHRGHDAALRGTRLRGCRGRANSDTKRRRAARMSSMV